MQKNIKISAATNNYTEINTMQRYIRHAEIDQTCRSLSVGKKRKFMNHHNFNLKVRKLQN